MRIDWNDRKNLKVTKCSVEKRIGNTIYIKARKDVGFCINHPFPDNHWQKKTRFYFKHWLPLCDECHKKSVMIQNVIKIMN